MNPITVIPWDRDFLSGLATHLTQRFQGRFDNVIVLFPHRRPRRYLREKLAHDPGLPKPCLLPKILSIGELFAELATRMHPQPMRPLSVLDRVGVLHTVTKNLKTGPRGDTPGFPAELKDFFPWGLRLAALMEELFEQGISAQNLDHVQDMVMPTAAALLASLKTIQSGYVRALAGIKASTPGFLSSAVAADPGRAASLLEGKTVLACGFHALTGNENALLQALWRKGCAEILWHTDPAVATPGHTVHWSCQEHQDWLKLWKAKVQLASDATRSPLPSWRNRTDQFSLFSAVRESEPSKRAAIVFHQGFDLHSQLAGLQKELAALPDSGQGGYAVVLPDTGMLMPVLHHLPRQDVNVSMGYPLERSSLAQLLEALLALQDGRGQAGYHWREVVALLRHPLLKFLRLENETPLRALFHQWETAARQGEKYLDPLEALASFTDAPEDVLALAGRVVRACFTAFEDTKTPRAMALALSGLAGLLLDPQHSGNRWERFIIDASCLAGLLNGVIPELHGSLISQENFPPETIRSMTRELIARQRIPFHADPLSGLQVMGMLETRLISFERVFILGANEEVLPGSPGADPLLPDPLRQSLGLPGQRERDLSAAHTFYRLIQGAREVGIFYAKGVQPGILDGKSQPSRYVEQLIWEEEKRLKTILKPGQGPIRRIDLPLRGLPVPETAVEHTRASRLQLETLLRYRGVSPTLLDSFVHCPLAFYYKYLTPLRPLEEVAEEGDPPALGELVHETLHECLKPLLGQSLEAGQLDGEALARLFLDKLRQARFHAQMPVHLRVMLEQAGQRRMRSFAENQPACTPLELEHPFQATLEARSGSFKVTGTIDRLDLRASGLCVIDYKTGQHQKPSPSFWGDEAIWEAVEACGIEAGLALLPKISRTLRSLQMPLYLYAYAQASGREIDNGIFVCLGEDGKENPLFAASDEAHVRQERIARQTPSLAVCIIRMMLETPRFAAQPSPRCGWCAFRHICAAGAMSGK